MLRVADNTVHTQRGFCAIKGICPQSKLSPGWENERSRGWKGKEVRTPSSAQSLLQKSGSLKTPQTKQDGKVLRAAYLCPGT